MSAIAIRTRGITMLLGLIGVACLVGFAGISEAQKRRSPITAPPSFPGKRPMPRSSDPGQYYLELAQVHQRYQHDEDAAKCYAKAIEVAKSGRIKVQILTAWSSSLMRQKKPADAQAKLEQALSIAGDKRDKCRIALSLARLLEEQGKTDDAAKQYEFVMSNTDQPWQRESAQSQLFAAYQKAGKLDTIAKKYEDALAKNPNDELALRALLSIHSRIKPDMEAARRVCSQLAAIKQDDPDVMNQLAGLHLRANDVKSAVAIYRKLAEKHPAQKTRYYERISSAYLRTDDKDKALEWAEKIVKADDKNPQAWSRFAEICMRAEQTGKALEALKKAGDLARSGQQKEMIQLRLADAYRSMKRDDDAINIYKELSENCKSAHIRRRAKRQLFDLYEQKGMLDKVDFDKPGKPAPKKPVPKKPAE